MINMPGIIRSFIGAIASLWLAVMCDIDIAENARREADGAVSR
jgi:hypothetical protein